MVFKIAIIILMLILFIIVLDDERKTYLFEYAFLIGFIVVGIDIVYQLLSYLIG